MSITDASESNFATSRSIQLGWGLPALFATQSDDTTSIASDAAVLDAALAAAMDSNDLAPYAAGDLSDFGDIAVRRSEDADSDQVAAADEVFELIGSGAF